jgi:hypothetical protein
MISARSNQLDLPKKIPLIIENYYNFMMQNGYKKEVYTIPIVIEGARKTHKRHRHFVTVVS